MAIKRGRFSEEQIVGILKEHEAGRKMAELARAHGVSEGTLYGWKSKYGGMEVGEAHRLRSLEGENRRLKQLVAELSLDKAHLFDTSNHLMHRQAPPKHLEVCRRRRFDRLKNGLEFWQACNADRTRLNPAEGESKARPEAFVMFCEQSTKLLRI
jgi:putative transposase